MQKYDFPVDDVQQTAETVTTVIGRKVGSNSSDNEVLYECRGWNNLDEVVSASVKWANENGYEVVKVSIQ